jgi:hypothetical protein
VDAKSVSFGHEQQFGVEEPSVVLHERQENGHQNASHGFETTLGIAEPAAHQQA